MKLPILVIIFSEREKWIVKFDCVVQMLWYSVLDVLIAYISRGLLSSLMEPKQVLTVISDENKQTLHRVVINTYAVIDGKFYL